MPPLEKKLRALGEYLGYPRCCVDHYIAKHPGPWHVRNEPEAWDATGFIPCNECRPLCIDDVQFAAYVDVMIRPMRQSKEPFPAYVILPAEVATWTKVGDGSRFYAKGADDGKAR